MIGADATTVRTGFDALKGADFDEYNLPQAWVERRQIPKVLHGRVPARHASIVDLGCGPGTSTDVLCYFAESTWTIRGYDLTPHLIAAARARAAKGDFRNRHGATVRPEFFCQSIAMPLRMSEDSSGVRLIPEKSVDLAISGGVVGLYLQIGEATELLTELRRIVKHGGFIALDAGPAIPVAALTRLATAAGFTLVGRAESVVFEPRPKLIFQLPET